LKPVLAAHGNKDWHGLLIMNFGMVLLSNTIRERFFALNVSCEWQMIKKYKFD